jgi:hypothetical protein
MRPQKLNFATTYDDFVVNGSNYTSNEIQWTGGYFNPNEQGNITG